jgi:hypothetical protein
VRPRTGERCGVVLARPGGEWVQCTRDANYSYWVSVCDCHGEDGCQNAVEIHECDGPHDYGC